MGKHSLSIYLVATSPPRLGQADCSAVHHLVQPHLQLLRLLSLCYLHLQAPTGNVEEALHLTSRGIISTKFQLSILIILITSGVQYLLDMSLKACEYYSN